MSKIIVCNCCQILNDFEYNDDVLSHNEELYNFTTSYFVTEPAFDGNNIEEITTNLKSNKSIEYEQNETAKYDSPQTSMMNMREYMDSITENTNVTNKNTKESSKEK